MYSGGKSLYGTNPALYAYIGQGNIAGVPTLAIIMLLFIGITYFVLNKTLVGRYLYATGGNENTARLSGIDTVKYKYIGLMISGAFAGFAGVLLAGRLGSGQPTAGDRYTMEALHHHRCRNGYRAGVCARLGREPRDSGVRAHFPGDR